MINTISEIQLYSGFMTSIGSNFYPVSEILRILNFPNIKDCVVVNINQRENIEKEITPISHRILFMLCISGQLHIEIDKKSYMIDSYSICIVLPDMEFSLLQKSQDLLIVFLNVTLSKDIINALMSEVEGVEVFGCGPCFSIRKNEVTDLLDFGLFFNKAFTKNDHPYHIEMVKKILCAMIYAIQDLYVKNQEIGAAFTEKEKIFMNFRRLLIQYYPIREPLFYSKKLSYTAAYLSKVIKEFSGKSVSQWIDELILEHAKILLTETNTTITSISRKLNFHESEHFRFFFKKRTGLCPRQFRKSNHSNADSINVM